MEKHHFIDDYLRDSLAFQSNSGLLVINHHHYHHHNLIGRHRLYKLAGTENLAVNQLLWNLQVLEFEGKV